MRILGAPSIKPVRTWGNSWRATLSHAEHARGAALVVRWSILASALAIAGSMTYLDRGDRPWQWLLIIGIPGIVCAVLPDSHFGLLVVAATLVPWLREIDDVTSPWSLVIAMLLGVLHVSMASAAAAPGAAPWTPTMTRRHATRVVLVAGAAAFAWVVVAGLAEYRSITGAVVAVALFVVAVGAVWARDGRVRGRP